MADASRDVTARQVSTAAGRLHVSDHAGDEPALVTAAQGAHLASLFPRADTHLVDGASHWPQWHRPKAVSELIR